MILALNRITDRWVGRSEHGLRGHAVQRQSLDKLTAAAHARRKCISGGGGGGGGGATKEATVTGQNIQSYNTWINAAVLVEAPPSFHWKRLRLRAGLERKLHKIRE